MDTLMIALVVAVVCTVLGLLIGLGLLRFAPWQMWFKCRALGMDVSFGRILGLWFARIPIDQVQAGQMALRAAGIDMPLERLLAHQAAGGNVQAIATATAAAKRGGLKVGFEQLCALDLAGGDAVASVRRELDPSIFHGDQQYLGIKVGDRGTCTTAASVAGQADFGGRTVRIVGFKAPVQTGSEVTVMAIDGSVLSVSSGGPIPVEKPTPVADGEIVLDP